jgi:hypothetical protein
LDVQVIADMIVLARSHGHSGCTDFNIGGGLGIRYVHDDKPPSIQVSNFTAVNLVLKILQFTDVLVCRTGSPMRARLSSVRAKLAD